MTDEDGRINIDAAVQLIFNDACKNISDLKGRQWQATTLSIAGIVGISAVSHGSQSPGQAQQALSGHWQESLTAFIVLIMVGYLFVMWRCNTNLNKFKKRLTTLVDDKFPVKEGRFFGLVDEGTIMAVAYFAVILAFLFAILDIWR